MAEANDSALDPQVRGLTTSFQLTTGVDLSSPPGEMQFTQALDNISVSKWFSGSDLKACRFHVTYTQCEVGADGDSAAARWNTILDCGLLPLLTLLGSAGNCLCAAVILRLRYRAVSVPILLALCHSDTIFLLSTFLERSSCIVCKLDRETGNRMRIALLPQVRVLGHVMARVTGLLTLALAVERCVAITRPFKLRALCTMTRTRNAVLLMNLIVVTVFAPAFFLYDVTTHVEPLENVTRTGIQESIFYQHNRHFLDFYFDFFLHLLLHLLPLTAICICLTIIILTLDRPLHWSHAAQNKRVGAARHAQGESTARDNGELVLEERKLSRTLLTLITIYVLSEIPMLVTRLVLVNDPRFRTSDYDPFSLKVASGVCDSLVVINSSVKFFVYIVMNKHFSVTFRRLSTCAK